MGEVKGCFCSLRTGNWSACVREGVDGQTPQSLEFVAEMRILTEMKIENHGTKCFLRGKIDKNTFFFFL